MNAGDYPRLEQFLNVYFIPSWRRDHATEFDVVRAYVSENPVSDIDIVVTELGSLLSSAPTDADVTDLLERQFAVAFGRDEDDGWLTWLKWLQPTLVRLRAERGE